MLKVEGERDIEAKKSSKIHLKFQDLKMAN